MLIDESNIRKTVIKLSTPAVIEQTLFMVVGVVSTILVGRIGNSAISAVGLIVALTNIIMVIFVALSTGGTVVVARLIGEGRSDKAKNTVIMAALVGAIFSVFVTILSIVFSYDLICLFFGNAEPEILKFADIYFRITSYSFPLLLVNTIISGCLRGAGDTKTPMTIAYIFNIINVVLGIILIYGISTKFITIGAMGITGAAIAVSVSRGIGGLLSIGALFRPKSVLRLDKICWRDFDFSLMKRMLRIGVPATLEQIIMQGGFLVLQVIISNMGTTAMTIYQIGMNINSIIFIPGWGIGIAATTLVGQSLGNRRPDLSEKFGWESLKISVVLSVILSALVFAFARGIISAYTNDYEVIIQGTSAIRIFCLSQPFLAVVVVLSGCMRGAGDMFYVAASTFVGIWLFRVGVTYLLGMLLGMGIMGVWLAVGADFLIRAAMYAIRFKRGRWKYISV